MFTVISFIFEHCGASGNMNNLITHFQTWNGAKTWMVNKHIHLCFSYA